MCLISSFNIPRSLLLIYSFYRAHLIPVESFLHYLTITPSTASFPRVATRKFEPQEDALGCWSASGFSPTHTQLWKNRMYLSDSHHRVSLGFAEICVSLSKRGNKKWLYNKQDSRFFPCLDPTPSESRHMTLLCVAGACCGGGRLNEKARRAEVFMLVRNDPGRNSSSHRLSQCF